MSVEALEKWVHGQKGRYVRDLSIDDGYGATCWQLILGNVSSQPGPGWYTVREGRAEIFVQEVSFFVLDNDTPPNVVYAVDGDSDDDWPGLSGLIKFALKKAEELDL